MLPPGYNPGEILRDAANPIVAEVDGHPITLADVGDAIRALPPAMRELPFEELFPNVLERLIKQQALVVTARRMRLDSDPIVKRHVQAAADRVLENELLNRQIDKTISEQALLARYQQKYRNEAGPEEAEVSVILVPTESAARKDLEELKSGADFAVLARRDSKDASARTGGSLGFLRQDKLLPEVGAVAFALEPGSVAPNPIRTSAGWFVVKVTARRRVVPQGFAEVREQSQQPRSAGAEPSDRRKTAGPTGRFVVRLEQRASQMTIKNYGTVSNGDLRFGTTSGGIIVTETDSPAGIVSTFVDTATKGGTTILPPLDPGIAWTSFNAEIAGGGPGSGQSQMQLVFNYSVDAVGSKAITQVAQLVATDFFDVLDPNIYATATEVVTNSAGDVVAVLNWNHASGSAPVNLAAGYTHLNVTLTFTETVAAGAPSTSVVGISTLAQGFGETAISSLYSIGDYVWTDDDLDGVQDSTEAGIQGVKVN